MSETKVECPECGMDTLFEDDGRGQGEFETTCDFCGKEFIVSVEYKIVLFSWKKKKK